MRDVKTKFDAYVSFGTKAYDTTPEVDTDNGYINLFVVTLDGEYTHNDLKEIIKKMEQIQELAGVPIINQ
jgi:hypothetical protein